MNYGMDLIGILKICIEIVTNDYIAAVIEAERWLNVGAFADDTEDLSQHCISFFPKRLTGCILG